MKWILYALTGLSPEVYPDFDVDFVAPLWFLILVTLLLLSFFVLLFFELKESGLKKGKKLLILIFASLVILITLFISSLPQANFYKVRVKNLNALFMLDESLSMNLPAGGINRCKWVRDFIIRNRSSIEKVNKYFSLDFYGWGKGNEFLGRIKRGEFTESLLDKILKKYMCNQERSNLHKALSSLEKNRKYSWIMVLTDGVVEEEVPSSVPMYVVYPPDSSIVDISVTGVDIPEFAYVRSPVEVELSIESRFTDVVNRVLSIYEDGKLIKNQMITIKPGLKKYEVELRPNFTGDHIYTFKISTEREKFPLNNSYSVILNVLLDKIRVLHIVGRPTWDSRFLRLYLKSDPRIDLVSFIILRSNSDEPMSGDDELSLIPFPAETLFYEELNNFDVLILQNFDYASYFALSSYMLLQSIKEFVVKRGGGLVLIGGELSFSEGAYQYTPVDEILPVEVLPENNQIYPGKVKLHLTDEGSISPITSLGLTPEEAKRLWNLLPPLDGENLVGGLRKNSAPLLVDQKRGNIVVAVRNVGRGRTLSIATDSLWEMAFRNPENDNLRRGYFLFWKRAIRWLIRDESFKQMKISPTPSISFPGERIKINIKAFQSDFKPILKKDLEVYVRKKGSQKTYKPELSGNRGIYSFTVTFTSPGTYVVSASYKKKNIKMGDSALILVKDPAAEEIRIMGIQKNLIRGKEIKSFDTDLLIKKVVFSPSSRMIVGEKVVSLWDNPWILALLMLFFVFLWGLRRRSGLL